MRVVTLDAMRTGDWTGPPVVLLHPVGLDGPVWAPLAARLPGPVLAPSLRGHGTSPAPPGPWPMRELAADVHALLAATRLTPAHVVGLSLGGMVAQQLAVDHPEDVDTLVLIGTSAGFAEPAAGILRQRGRRALDDGMEAVIDETVTRWFTPAARLGPVAGQVRRRLLDNDPRSWATTWEAMAGFDLWPRLRTITAPTLVLGGTADASISPAVSSALAAALPRADLRIVEGAGHLAPLETPDTYATLIAAFTNGRVPG